MILALVFHPDIPDAEEDAYNFYTILSPRYSTQFVSIFSMNSHLRNMNNLPGWLTMGHDGGIRNTVIKIVFLPVWYPRGPGHLFVTGKDPVLTGKYAQMTGFLRHLTGKFQVQSLWEVREASTLENNSCASVEGHIIWFLFAKGKFIWTW